MDDVRPVGSRGDREMTQRLHSLSCFLTLAVLAFFSTDDVARASHKPQQARKPHEATGVRHHRNAAVVKTEHAKHVMAAQRKSTRPGDAPPPSGEAFPLSADLAAVRNAIYLARKAKTGEATAVQKTIGDPAARRLVEWFILRHPEADANFSRYAAFIADSPDWPSIGLMRKRAEARLWQERSDAATIRNFMGDHPTSAKGRFALARVLLAEGDRDGAGSLVAKAGGWMNCQSAPKPTRSSYSTTCSPARTIVRAWTSVSVRRIFRARGALHNAWAATSFRS
jgi:soluble lytic murein transglycosylase